MKEFITCKTCDGAGIIHIYDAFEKPYEECHDCEGHGAFLVNGKSFSILPMFDEVRHFTKIENNKEVIYHAYYLKGVLQKIITDDAYSSLVELETGANNVY